MIEARPLTWNGSVVLYTDLRTGRRVAGKFYARKPMSGTAPQAAILQAQFMRRELENLLLLHDCGLGARPCRVVRPLGVNEALGCLLVQEFAAGRSLHAIVEGAAATRNGGAAAAFVETAAGFLAALHRCPTASTWLQAGDPVARLVRIDEQLSKLGLVGTCQSDRLKDLARLWGASGVLQQAAPVLIHGDATPPHFIFVNSADELIVIDFERLWPGDAAADLGSMAAELKHLFWRFANDPWASEPLIRGLYAAYQRHAGVDPSLTLRARYYQGLQQLRIGRNEWLGPDLRRALIEDGLRCLEAP